MNSTRPQGPSARLAPPLIAVPGLPRRRRPPDHRADPQGAWFRRAQYERDRARQASDREQLDFAVARRRALVTFNVADFVREARGYALADRDHCGIVVSDQLEIGEPVRRMTKVLGVYSASDMINRFVWLQSFA